MQNSESSKNVLNHLVWMFEGDWNVLELKNQISDNFETYGHIIMVTVLVKDYYDSFRIE